MRHRTLAGLIVLCLGTAALAQEARTNMGMLTCTLGGAEGLERNMSCGFKPTGSGGEGRYAGIIRGHQAAPAGKRVLIWIVMGPANMQISPSALAQRYAAGRSVSGQPSTLVGEKDSSIVLQSETNNGTEASDAVTQIELRLMATPV
jgi:predicted metal-binding membrane protein